MKYKSLVYLAEKSKLDQVSVMVVDKKLSAIKVHSSSSIFYIA